MNGKVCLVTGGNSGIGREIAVGLARLGATVVIVARDEGRGERAVAEIKRKTRSQNVGLIVADLSSMQSIRHLADEFMAKYSKLHVLINNAGVFLPKRIVTADGFESTFATNHLGHFLLTDLLLESIKASAPSRIINITSTAHKKAQIDFEDLMAGKKFSGSKAYGQSKLSNILFTYQLAKKLEGTGVTVNCLHPGGVRTGLAKKAGRRYSIGIRIVGRLLMSPEKSAEAAIYLATSPDLEGVTGKYFSKGKEEKSSAESYDQARAERLWSVSAELTKNVIAAGSYLPG
jgi:NAD(P)-dependent dehydrogenase (short-subunit alcohol dehydrogenase family)